MQIKRELSDGAFMTSSSLFGITTLAKVSYAARKYVQDFFYLPNRCKKGPSCQYEKNTFLYLWYKTTWITEIWLTNQQESDSQRIKIMQTMKRANTSWNLFKIFSKDFAACLVIQSPLFWGLWGALFSTSMSLLEKDLFVQKLFSLGWFFEKAAAFPLEIFGQTQQILSGFFTFKLFLNHFIRF